jgi:mRNA export factor
VQVFNLTNPAAVYKELESPLKFQTRCITCFPDSTGYLVGLCLRPALCCQKER